jgi:hypothetical protein
VLVLQVCPGNEIREPNAGPFDVKMKCKTDRTMNVKNGRRKKRGSSHVSSIAMRYGFKSVID